ncbi:uncharacterized protein si:ch211-286b5.2 isoform X2 [Hoplias malabaricus]|uniref:uncharacterized protein si:ch211-286b5.2 isoform X2 n=1 Tax=Hoplias malabaricus TaxID=27720 RepID=UPI003461E9DF
MKRKAQLSDFKPPQQRLIRGSRQNSNESIITSSETTELQPTDSKQTADTTHTGFQYTALSDNSEDLQPECGPELSKVKSPTDPFEIPKNGGQTNIIITNWAEINDIKYKPESKPTLEYASESSGMEKKENEIKHRSSPEIGENLLFGDVDENKVTALDPKAKFISDGEKSYCELLSMTPQEAEDAHPPEKKRLRRRMGMYGLGDRKRRFLLEEPQRRHFSNGEESKEMAEENRHALKTSHNSVEHSDGTAQMDKGPTEQVLSEQMIPAETLIIGHNRNEVEDLPAVAALTQGIDAESSEKHTESNHDGQDVEISVNPKGLLEKKERLHDGYAVTESAQEVAKNNTEHLAPDSTTSVSDEACDRSKHTNIYPVAEKVGFGNSGLTRHDFEGPKETSECPEAEELSNGDLDITKENCEGHECPVEVVEKGSDVAETFEIFKGTTEHPFKVTTEYPVTEKTGSGMFGINNEDSKETSGFTANVKEASQDAVDFTMNVSESFEHPVSEEAKLGLLGDINEVCNGSKDTGEHSVAAVENCGSADFMDENNEVCENSKTLDEAVKCGPTAVSVGDFKSSQNPIGCSVIAEVSYGSTDYSNEISYSSYHATEGSDDIAKDVGYKPMDITDDVSECSKEETKLNVEVAEELIYVTKDDGDKYCEGHKEGIELLVEVAKEPIHAYRGGADKCGGSAKLTERLAKVPEEISYSYTGVASELCEGLKEGPDFPVSADMSYGTTGVTEKDCEEVTKLTVEASQDELIPDLPNGPDACEFFQEPHNCPVTVPLEICSASNVIGSGDYDDPVIVSKEVKSSITALEECEMEIGGQAPPDARTHLTFNPSASSGEDQNGLQLPREIEMDPAFTEDTVTEMTDCTASGVCVSERYGGHLDLLQTHTRAVPEGTGPGGVDGYGTEERKLPKAPSAGQEKDIHVKQPLSDPTLITAATETSQDHDFIPFSLYSVTDSQLNSIALSMELDDQPLPEGFVHQEDATELVCGLIKELSSLNRIVMAAHRETELLRHGNRSSKTSTRHLYGPQNS